MGWSRYAEVLPAPMWAREGGHLHACSGPAAPAQQLRSIAIRHDPRIGTQAYMLRVVRAPRTST